MNLSEQIKSMILSGIVEENTEKLVLKLKASTMKKVF
ncbi:MAG: hypothetical protein Ct9H90mP20_2450 [Candidatus Neomarinimicrobiota bacterium]|nr:MAG: hypothetical protein Ct9H90mP20_2450 [Candidatus Neomarinimicrobiota bacterium]